MYKKHRFSMFSWFQLNECTHDLDLESIKLIIFFIKNIYIQMENGRMMVLHSVIIGVLLYIFMIFILGQNQIVAENRSILLAAVILIYMILFGHGLPTSINKNVF